MPRLALVALLGVGLVGVAGGCSRGAEAAPSNTTASVSRTTDAEAQRERDIADAEAAVRAFIAADAKVANNGFTDWRQTVMPLVTGLAQQRLERQYGNVEGKGKSSTGSATVELLSVGDYAVNRETGTTSVTLHLCFDASALRDFVNGVEETPDPGSMVRWVADYEVEHSSDTGKWLIANEVWTGKPC